MNQTTVNNTKQEILVDRYIGIPYLVNGRDFEGIDCWGLVHLIYKEELGIDVPSFAEDGIDANRTQELIAQYKEGWEQTDSPKAGDVVIFKILGVDAHIALAISSTHFIHARQGQNSAIESFDNPRWKTRFVGSYKYSPKKSVVLNGIPHPLRTERITTAIPPGTNIVQLQDWIVKQYNIAESYKPLMHVFVNGVRIPDEMKEATIIQDNDVVEYRVLAQGGGDFLRTALTIAVVIYAPQLAASISSIGGVALTTATGALTTAGTLVSLGLTAVGMALVDAIAPVRIPSSNFGDPTNPGSAEQQLMVTGGANQVTPYGSIPFVLGKVRLTPPLGANTYNLFKDEGKESYLRMLLVWGYGPLFVDETTLQIGELPISNYEGVTQETITYVSEPTAPELYSFNNLYGTDITQVSSGVELTCDGTAGLTSSAVTKVNIPTTAGSTITLPGNYIAGSISAKLTGQYSSYSVGVTITGSDATFYPIFPFTFLLPSTPVDVSYTVDNGGSIVPPYGPWLEAASTDGQVGDFTVAIHFPQGCRKIISKGASAGQSQASPVIFNIEYKQQSQANWSNSGVRYTVGETAAKDAFTWTKSFTVNSGEDVQVRVRRITGTGNTAPVDENYQWLFTSTLVNTTFSRNTTPAIDPLNCKIAKTALEIKASDQLNGQIEGINAIVWTYGKSWNGTAWVDGNINNPAALFRHVLEHPANPRRVTDAASKINLTQLQYWHEYCTSKGFTFNSVVGSPRSVLDILRDICAAGRASPVMVDGKWTVVIDEPKANVVQHFTPHNSWGFEGAKALPKIPDGLRVTFINEDKNYQEDETIVYAAGKSAANASLLESISVPGVTKLSQAQDHARWHMAQANLRPESYTLNTDIEYIVCNRGDRVKVMHDVPMWGLGSGRIKNKISNTVLELTEELPIDFATAYSIRFRSKTGASNDRVIQKTFTPTFASRTSNVVTITCNDHPLVIGDSVSVSVTGALVSVNPAIVTAVTTNTFSYVLAGSNITNTAVTGSVNLNDGYYSKIKITVASDTTVVDNDDLFLFGILNQEAQDCLVIAIEPQDNKTARISLVDYGVTQTYNIFTDYLNYTNPIAFESQITIPPKLLIQSFGTKVPTITGIISDERVMEKIAAGVFEYKMRVSYTNASGLPSTVSTVEFQWDFAAATDSYGLRSAQTPYNKGSIDLLGVEEGEALKVRCRYVGEDGRTGQWTAWTNHTVVGKKNPPGSVTAFSATPDAVSGKLILNWGKNPEVDLRAYEVRTDTNWGNTTNMIFRGEATTCTAVPPAVYTSTTFYIKAIDWSNNYSTTATTTTYTTNALINVSSATHSFYDTSTTNATVTVDWVDVAPVFGLKNYEISYVSGASTITKILNGSFITVPADWIGVRSFVIKTVDLNGQKSTGFTYNVTKLAPTAPATASFTVDQATLRLDWPDAVKTSLPVWGYEVRTDTNFGTAGFLFKGAVSACSIANLYLTLGANNFYIKTIDTDGYYSTTYLTATYTVLNPVGVTTVNHVFTDTSLTAATVTLDWNDVLPIFGLNQYEITYGSTVVNIKSSTITVPANWIGVNTFTIKVVDMLGNKSTGFAYNITKLAPTTPVSASFTVSQGTLRLDWPDVAKTSLPVWGYEVRIDTNFGTPGFLFKGATSACSIPNANLSIGVNSFYIKSIDTDGYYSAGYLTSTYNLSAPPNIAAATHVFADTSLTAASITLDWNDVSPVFSLGSYEVTYDAVVKTTKSSTITLPANWIGERSFVIKTIDTLGNKSSGFTKVVNKQVPNPVTNFRAQVIDNNVMLYWDLPAITSLPIDHVILKRGTTWAGAALIGDKKGGFTTQSEMQAGTYTYWIAVVDTDNNQSTPVSLTTKVSEPPDFVFHADYTSTFAGTKSSAALENARVVLPINTTETFQQHFVNNAWTTPQAQITAGYPIYIQPANGSGYYEETFDFGSILSSSRVTVVYNGTVVSGTPVITTNISVSDDNVTYVNYNGVSDIYATAFRYVKVRFIVSETTGTGLYSLSYLNVKLDAKLINDAGTFSALSTDTLGTIVNFNKAFIDVTSITLSLNTTSSLTAVYDFGGANVSATYAVVSNVCTVTATAHGFITGQKVRLQFSTGAGVSGVYTITGYTTNTFTVSMVISNTSGNNLVYPESCRVYVFNSTTGVRASCTGSWSVKGY